MRAAIIVAASAATALGLSACGEHYEKVPGTNLVHVYDSDGSIDRRSVDDACLSTGVKEVRKIKYRNNDVEAYVICR